MKCRLCNNERLIPLLNLGKTPLANSYPPKEQLGNEEEFPLEIALCDSCKLVTLTFVADPKTMFSDYLYVTSTTKTFQLHFTKMAEDLIRQFKLNNNSLVVDIGSNDGLLLSGFKKMGAKVVGVEPATNLAKLANQAGIETLNDFFNEGTVEEIIKKQGKADIITATNVFAHIDDIQSVTHNVKKLLKDEGVFVIEAAYLIDMINQMTFDSIYHEHLCYYSLTPLANFFKRFNMRVFDVKHVDTHGGSLRVFVCNQNSRHHESPDVQKMLDNEIAANKVENLKAFASRVTHTKKALVDCIKSLKSQGKKIAGYGAPAKATTLLNFCGLDSSDIDYIVDDNPMKVGLHLPGTKIPIVSSKSLDEKNPDYILILAWNFSKEIMEKTKRYHDQGIKYIIPVPEATIK